MARGGCGDVGSYVVRDLMAHSDARVTLADYRLDGARALADRFGDRADAACPIWTLEQRPDPLLGPVKNRLTVTAAEHNDPQVR